MTDLRRRVAELELARLPPPEPVLVLIGEAQAPEGYTGQTMRAVIVDASLPAEGRDPARCI